MPGFPPILTLKKDLGRILRQGHPWVFRDAIATTPTLAPGSVVAVADKRGHMLAHGFWDAEGPIAVRVLDRKPVPDPAGLVRQRLGEALAMRQSRIDLSSTNAFRWVHGEGDRLPGIHVDVYADVATVRFDGHGSRAFYARLADCLRGFADAWSIRAVVDRESRSNLDEEIEIRENNIRFIVDLGRGQKGGLFLDQRENRIAVANLARGKRMLNLFGYTGGFSVHAAVAGALATDTVDIARPAIAMAKRNFEINDLDLAHAGLHAIDVFAFLEDAIARGERWDIVISDPPSFAPSKTSLPAARNSYLRLHRLAAQVVSPDGIMCAASCSSHLRRDEFLDLVSEGAAQAGRRFALEWYAGAGLDHPTSAVFPEGDYLKFALGKLR